ncbi:M48 family metallopeptidase [Mesorhizobium retamae]|uniref:M48 family metallopeptidase n=1 Tax=Mesorhizobium retamae TaxID=2912854 RepID=A0ABS9Q809_9HYPH|nr:M48 family metallopeptidase [Mesorhizobium sp. IRAMC:0171]MCG7503555.1 M48 family metallopeptidase [Mesorhizobium sp. IRAMC:0171]
MRSFVFIARRIGRFAILFLVVLLLCPLLIWLLFLDSHPIVLILGGIVAIPSAILAAVLIIGMLFAGFRRTKLEGISREAAPELWALWEVVAGENRAKRTTIVLDDRLNAAVAEEQPFLGLFGHRVFLFVGIPLMMVTDSRALSAVFAHENAHVRNRDTNGGLKLAELEKSFNLIFDYAPPGQSVSGSLLYAALSPLSRALQSEELRLSRLAELQADRHAAVAGDAHEAARALVLVAAADACFEEKVYEPLQRELLGAMTPPRPPLARLALEARNLEKGSLLQPYAQKAWDKPDNPESDHPSLSIRLAALGYNVVPTVEPVSASALFTLLGDELAAECIRHFDHQWVSAIEDRLER